MKTHEMAFRLLAQIETNPNAVINGYGRAAELIGWANPASCARAMGQVTSLLDYACFVAGLPMLAFKAVKNAEGEVPEASFGGAWAAFRDEIERESQSFVWTQAHFAKVRSTLVSLDARGAKAFWNEAAERGEKYIRFNLHRSVIRERTN